MKYLLLPIHLLKFWYIESLFFFARTWKNIILYFEEDLAVGLMWRLLFVPLFHDSSIIGRILSVVFRFSRILIGLFAFALASFSIVSLALFWLLLPVLVIKVNLWLSLILFSGVGLFIIHIVTHPHKTAWQIKDNNFWPASKIKKKNLNFHKLLQSPDVLSLLAILETNPENFSGFGFSDLDQIGKLAFDLAKKTECRYIESVHFFVASLKLVPDIEVFLLKLNLKLEDFEEALFFLEKKKNKWRLIYPWDSDFAIHHLKGVNRGWLGVPTPVLDSVSEDVTRMASVGFPDFMGRKATLIEVINLLSEEGKRNIILVSPPGAGKSALINYLAKMILAGDAPPTLATKRLVRMDTTKLLSGMKTQGDLADRVKTIFAEVAFAGNIILVIEEIHNLGIGEAGTLMNLYSLIQPYIENSGFQFIATTEQENYTRILEKNGSLIRLFTKVELPPAIESETVEILEDRAIEIEQRKRVRVSLLALKKTVQLSAKLIHDRVLPDSALAVLDEAVSLQGNALERSGGWITSQVVEDVISKRVNVPVLELGNVGKEKLLNLENELHLKLIDQEEAVKVVSDSLRRSATGIREGQRPIGSFLFVGPTGVGKTELAKTLAEVYFAGHTSEVKSEVNSVHTSEVSQEGAFLRFDMSEYQSGDSVNKLIGAPGEEGQLTEQVRNRQYGLILLDEFEKADPKILTLFLQVLEDGRLTDGEGKLIDFTNTIIIATSNAASLTIARGLESGQKLEQLEKQVQEELLQIFKPELVNRFDAVVLFKPLSKSDLQKIVRLKLAGLQAQMRNQGYLIEFDEELVSELAKKGFDPVLGARPMRRLIQDTLESNLSKMILENKLIKGETFKVGPEIIVN